MRQTIRVLVEDKHGVLLRVAGIISAKGANIHTLTVTPDPWEEGVSTITLASDLEPRLHQRVVNEMNRLVNVFLAVDVTANEHAASGVGPVREALSAQHRPSRPAAQVEMSQEPAW